jgi:hypothetical protein
VTGEATLIGVNLKMEYGYLMKRELNAVGIINPSNNV